MGAKPHRSEQFVKISVMKILKNPTYTGKIVWNQKTKYTRRPRSEWTVVNGMHQAIISEKLFEKTQRAISFHAHPPSNTGQVKNPLAGLIFCKHCGGLMQRQQMRRSGSRLMCPKRGCMVSISLLLVEETVLAALRSKLKSIPLDSQDRPNPQQSPYKEAIKSIEAERQTIGRQLDKSHDLLEQGIYSADEFLQRQKALNEKLGKLNSAKSHLIEKQKTHDLKKTQYEAIQNVLNLYENSSPQRQNELLKSVINKIVYTKQKGAKPNEFKLEFFFLPFYL
jgi:DNA-directed RNA polymerase subunit M/transcription elongation factor TFIIS